MIVGVWVKEWGRGVEFVVALALEGGLKIEDELDGGLKMVNWPGVELKDGGGAKIIRCPEPVDWVGFTFWLDAMFENEW